MKFCELCSDKLSKERHYSFGLIQMNSVFNILGRVFRPNGDEHHEERTLFAALKNSIQFKLQAEDQIMFAELIKDVFPRIEEIARLDGDNSFDACFEQNGYQPMQKQKSQICHLQEVLENSNSALLLGHSGGGKSVVIEIYLKLLKEKHKELKSVFLSPKSCGVEEFFGGVEGDSFKDGLFVKLFKEACVGKKKTVFVFDSQIDPLWVEYLSSVLDKSRCLTQLNADRLFYDVNLISFIFESGSLQMASPAILPRTSVIYVAVTTQNYQALWTSLKEQKFPDTSAQLEKLFKQFVPALFDFIRDSALRTIIPFSEINAINQFTDVLDVLISSKLEHLTASFIQALYLSIGYILLQQEYEAFDLKVKALAKLEIIQDSREMPAKIEQLPKGKLFEYVWDGEKECWINWLWMEPRKMEIKLLALEENLIQTPMTNFYHWFMAKWAESNFQSMVFKKVLKSN